MTAKKKKGKKILKKLAEEGHIDSQKFLGDYYFDSSSKKCGKWYKMGAEQGDDHCKVLLARYYHIFTFTSGAKKAINILTPMADNDNKEAAYQLGRIYFPPRGVMDSNFDSFLAKKYFKIAHELGDKRAEAQLQAVKHWMNDDSDSSSDGHNHDFIFKEVQGYSWKNYY